MPDRDIVERSLHRIWRSPYRLMKGRHPPEMVSEELIRALAASLRDSGGVPSGLERVLAVQALPGDGRTLAEVSRAIEQDFCQQKGTKLLARAAQRTLAKVEARRALPGPLPVILEYLRTYLQHHFFAKVGFRLVGKRGCFRDVQGLREFEASVWSLLEPQLIKLAHRLDLDPTASTLRAPKSGRRRPLTAQLIDVPLMGSEPK